MWLYNFHPMLEHESFDDLEIKEKNRLAEELYTVVVSKFPNTPLKKEQTEITYVVPFDLVQNTLENPGLRKGVSLLTLTQSYHEDENGYFPMYSIATHGNSDPFAKNRLDGVTLFLERRPGFPVIFRNYDVDSEHSLLGLIPTEATLADLRGFKSILHSTLMYGKRVHPQSFS